MVNYVNSMSHHLPCSYESHFLLVILIDKQNEESDKSTKQESENALRILWWNLCQLCQNHQSLRRILTKWKAFRTEDTGTMKGIDSMTDEASLKELWILNL